MRVRESLTCALLIVAAACSGGTGGAAPALETAALQGLVYEVDGQTVDRAGVSVTVLETGDRVTTGPDGRFAFPDLPAGSITLAFGSSLAVLAQQGGDDGAEDEQENEDETEDESEDETEDESEDESEDEFEDEDEDGNPRVACQGGDTVEVRAAMSGGELSEFSATCSDRLRSEARLARAEDSPDADVEGKVRVESRADREKFTVEIDHLAPGTVVEIFLDDPSDASGPVSIGTVAALSDGEAKLERNTADREALPLGAGSVDELRGFQVAVTLAATGATLLTGEVPALPDGVAAFADAPAPGGRGRGRAELTAHFTGLEGHIEIRRRPEDNEQRFKMESEHLAPGERVTFLIEDPDAPGSFVVLASVAADGDGEAEVSTQDGLPMPLGVTDVSSLVGLEVRVMSGEELLLSGTVPQLVAD